MKKTKAQPKKEIKVKEMQKVKKLSALVPLQKPEDVKSKKNEYMLGKTFVIESIRFLDGQNGKFAVCDITYNGQRDSWITSAMFVMPQLERIIGETPVQVKLDKSGRSFFLTDP